MYLTPCIVRLFIHTCIIGAQKRGRLLLRITVRSVRSFVHWNCVGVLIRYVDVDVGAEMDLLTG